MFSAQSVLIHSKLDLINIERLLLEETQGSSIGETDEFIKYSMKPVGDLAFAKVEPQMLKTLGYSLHRVATDCLKIDSSLAEF